MSDFRERFNQLKSYIQSQGWRWKPGKSIPHGEQIIVSDRDRRATIDFYPRRGRLVSGGPRSPLKAALDGWLATGEAASGEAEKASASGGTRLDALKRFIKEQGWNWGPGTEIPYGEQIVVSDAGVTALVNFWPKRGKMQLQGSNSGLKRRLEAWVDEQSEAEAGPPPISGPHIGLDEAGKGDWFGPLVVAAVHVDDRTAAALRRAGVRDSKALSRTKIEQLAGHIERAVPAARRHCWVMEPELYNQLYAEQANISLLLAEAYGRAAEKVWQATGELTIVCDQFTRRTDRLEQAFAARGLPQPRQQPRAEAASIAVAAASILASAAFGDSLTRLGWLAGLKGPLPRGASDLAKLEMAARHILADEGREALGRYAKLHFKPIQRLLG